jgi:hypothetical protein
VVSFPKRLLLLSSLLKPPKLLKESTSMPVTRITGKQKPMSRTSRPHQLRTQLPPLLAIQRIRI